MAGFILSGNGFHFQSKVLFGYALLSFIILLSPPKVLSNVEKESPLLIVSYDGFRWDYLNRTRTPVFHRIIKEGVWARKGVKNVFPTSTLTNHWSLVTGLYAESHGIIENDMFDPVFNETFVPLYANPIYRNNPGFYDVPGVQPIWVTNQLQKEHGRSGSIMWWGAKYAVESVRPTFHMHYNLDVDDHYKIDTMVKWFTAEHPINLGLLYLPEPDEIAHKYGPESVEVTKEIIHADELTGYLLQQLKKYHLLDKMNIILTSDHGAAPTSKDRLIMLDEIVDPTWYTVIHDNPVIAIIPHTGYEDMVYEKLKRAAPTGHFRVFKKADIPDELHYKHNRRVTPIIALADLSYVFMVNMSKENFTLKGTHGYDNSYEEMHPFFLAMGPAFKPGHHVDTFNSLDIYALMCHLLHLRPRPNNGTLSVVSQLLRSVPENKTTTLCASSSLPVLVVCFWLLRFGNIAT